VTDGQFFVYYIALPEAIVIIGGWWAWKRAWKRLQLRRSRTNWLRQLEARRQRRPAA
jgi:hypothetical protein